MKQIWIRKIWAICRFEIKRIFKKPSSYALMFAMPLIFTFIFGSLLGDGGPSSTKLAVLDQDRSTVSKVVINQLTQNNMLDIQQTSDANAEKLLHDKKISGIVIVPEGYENQIKAGQKAEIVFRHGPELAVAPAIRQTIEDIGVQSLVQVKAAQSWSFASGNSNWQSQYEKLVSGQSEQSTAVETKTVSKNENTRQLNNVADRAVGFSIMFLMITMLSVTGVFLDARKTGIWYRMLSTPASRWEIMLGYMLSFFLIGWIQFGVLMGTSALLFGIQWGNMLGQIVLVSSLLLCMIGLGLFIAGWVRTTEQQALVGNIVVVATCMLGGVYWPLDVVPDTMKKLAEFIPQTWAMRGFTELVARGGTLGDILEPTSVLLGFAVVFLVAGIKRVRYE